MKFVLEDNLKNRLISKISSMLCSKLDEHTDCFMPAKFNNCVKSGGKVRTKNLGGGKYLHL